MELGKGITPHPYPQSEGGQMKEYVMRKFNIPEEVIIVEDKAANTIENIARSLKPIDQEPSKFARLGFLGSPHHVKRIEKMVRLFGLEGPTMSSAEVVDRSRGEAGERPRDQRVHNRMERYRKYFEATLNPDTNPTYRKRLVEEERWSHGLDELPSYFLPQLRFIRNSNRLISILEADNLADYLLTEHGIDVETTDPRNQRQMKELRKALYKIKRELPGEEWAQMPDELPEWRYGASQQAGHNEALDQNKKVEEK